MRRALVGRVLAGTVVALTLTVAGCSGDDTASTSSGQPTVVTSTNVWGSVAEAVAGDKASVTVLFTSGDGDPHEFEPSAADTAAIGDADVVLLNGGGYDQYMETGKTKSGTTTINAFDVMEGDHPESADHNESTEHSDDHGSHDAEGHQHGEVNEHVFYNLPVVAQVANKIADALATKDAANAETYRANAAAFGKQIDGLNSQVAAIKTAHNGTKVAQTEPLAAYLLTQAGLVDVAPAGFTDAVEAGQSPSAADRAAMEDLLTDHTVKALIYNTQAVDPVTEALLSTAKSANVAVVKFTETLPNGVTSYIDWQKSQIGSLSAALGSPANG